MCRHRGIRRVIRGLNGILDYSLLLLLLLGLVYGCYALWDSQNLAEEATSEQYAIYKPQEDTLGFQELQSMNSDVIAWITVYDTPIDYPVVQGKDNWEYVNKNAEGEYSLTGAIFMDSENNPDFQDFNTILYGHNMVPNVMFGSIKEFKEQAFYEAHPYGNLFVQNRNFGLEIIALIEADAYDSSVFNINITRNDSIPYLEVIRNHAVYMNDITLEADDRILLLSTCSSESTNGRDILVARITDQTYKDTYSAKDQDHAGHESVDRRGGWRDFIPGWKTALFLLLLLLILICFADQWICRRRRKGRK